MIINFEPFATGYVDTEYVIAVYGHTTTKRKSKSISLTISLKGGGKIDLEREVEMKVLTKEVEEEFQKEVDNVLKLIDSIKAALESERVELQIS